MSRVQGSLAAGGGGLVPNPVRVGPLIPANKTPTYLVPVCIARQVFTDVAASDDDAFVTAKTSTSLPSTAGTVTFTPDGVVGTAANTHPRNVLITVTHASSVVAASGTITGRDEYGNAITEDWSVTATGTSKTYVGKKAFSKISSVTYTTAANAQANTFKVGTGVVLGLQFACAVASAVKEIAAGSVVTNGTVVAASTASTDDRRGTYSPNTAPNGTNDYEIFYLVNDPSVGL